MYRYIVIDDEKFTRIGTIGKLEGMSNRLICAGEASNGEQGLSLIEEVHPHIVITDMKMPVLGGEQLLPILAKNYPDIYIIVISGYQDFEYSRQAIRANAIDYILKPFGEEDIIHAVTQAIDRIENASVMKDCIKESEDYKEALCYSQDIDILRAMIDGYSKASPQLSSSRLDFISRCCQWQFITLHSKDILPENDIQRFLSEKEYNSMCVYLPHRHAQNLGYLLVFYSSGIREDSRYVCTHLLQELDSYLMSESSLLLGGISNLHSALEDMHTAFKESIQSLNQKKINDTNRIFFHTAAKPVSNLPLWSHEDELLFYIESGKTESVTNLVTDLFDHYRSLSNIRLYEIKYNCQSLANQVKLMLNQYIEQITINSSDSSVQNMLDTMFSLDELYSYYLQFFTTISNLLSKDNVYSDSDIIVNVRTYIERNYQKDISVEFVASLFHMNRSYLSHIFKKKQGISFGDYLNLVRLKQAKSQLEKTDKKMHQIAKSAGYDNVRSLYRAFRKFEHTTPEQYRTAKEWLAP